MNSTMAQRRNVGQGNDLRDSRGTTGGRDAARSAPVNRGRESATKSHSWIVVLLMQIVSVVLVIAFFVIPAFIKIYPPIITDVAFLNKINWPPFIDLNKPSDFGLSATRNFHMDTEPGIRVGAWQMLPANLWDKKPSSEDEYIKLLKSGNPLVLYLHGNAGTRAAWHRVQLYKLLTNAGYHVVTLDYRGYGDSTGHPSEDGLVHDSVALFKWIKQHSGDIPVFIWGHSLGSAVATKTSRVLSEAGAKFNGLILESPFNNFIEAASNHPFSAPFRILPWFTWCFIEGIKQNNITFSSDENIGGVAVPTIILHAEDDGVVPYSLGRKLYEAAQRTKKTGGVEFVTFEGQHNYGHKHIHKAPNLMSIVKKFTDEHSVKKN